MGAGGRLLPVLPVSACARHPCPPSIAPHPADRFLAGTNGAAGSAPHLRNHNGLGWAGQEFYRWDSVAAIARTAVRIRYALLPFWYTLMEESHRNGAAVVRPLFYEFPTDPVTVDIDRQFLLGYRRRCRPRAHCHLEEPELTWDAGGGGAGGPFPLARRCW